ncbi:MAG: rhodanese-like domain-containing protein [Deltaproteobacteria bacterium]|nr:rhodanese-like domain-containing protein [Deltaproteobacteria bacterium]
MKADEVFKIHGDANVTVVDVRTGLERRGGHIAGSVHIPLQQLAERAGELDTAKDIIVYCLSGTRSAMGVHILRKRGFAKVQNFSGGWLAWKFRGFPVEGEKT